MNNKARGDNSFGKEYSTALQNILSYSHAAVMTHLDVVFVHCHFSRVTGLNKMRGLFF